MLCFFRGLEVGCRGDVVFLDCCIVLQPGGFLREGFYEHFRCCCRCRLSFVEGLWGLWVDTVVGCFPLVGSYEILEHIGEGDCSSL